MTPVSRHARNGVATLHYLDSGGDDPRPPVVFVPGMTDVAEDYRQVLPLFGRRVVVVEIRGHGLSSSPAGGYDLASRSSDVGAVIDEVTDGPVHLVTFSRGTSYAVKWAIDHPGRTSSIAIGDYVPEEKTLTEAQGRDLVNGRWRGSPVRERLDERAATRTFRRGPGSFDVGTVACLKIPLLAVRSGNSVIVPDDDWARYQRTFPGATLVEFADSPHDIFRPDRGRYPRLVREHVDSADSH